MIMKIDNYENSRDEEINIGRFLWLPGNCGSFDGFETGYGDLASE